METIKKLLSNFLKAQEEKIKTPIFITFLIVLLVFKIWIYWKPISIFLLSTQEIESRIKAIDMEISLIEKKFQHFSLLAKFFICFSYNNYLHNLISPYTA